MSEPQTLEEVKEWILSTLGPVVRPEIVSYLQQATRGYSSRYWQHGLHFCGKLLLDLDLVDTLSLANSMFLHVADMVAQGMSHNNVFQFQLSKTLIKYFRTGELLCYDMC